MTGKEANPSSLTLATTAGVVALASCYYAWSKKKKKLRDDEIVLPLLPLESGPTMFENVGSISTLTWYKGNLSYVSSSVKVRVAAILRANPWLGGRFEKINGQVSIVYKAGGGDARVDEIFTVLSASRSPISRDTPYEQLEPLLKPYLVGRGIDLLRDTTKPFLRVTLIPDQSAPQKRFALVFSSAHVVGDGHTFYTLHNMMDTSRRVVALNPIRKPKIMDEIATALGGEIYASSLSNPPLGFVLRFLKGMLVSSVLGPRTQVHLFYISEEWIQQEKARAQTNLPDGCYPSTNDVVTARFFECTQVDEGIMALNFRNKIDGCLEQDAGNYFNYLVCRPSDYSTAHIRSSVQKIQTNTPLQPTTKPMTTWEHLTSKSLYGATSNWSSFCLPVDLGPDCEQELHFPIMPTDSVSCPATFVTGLFLFRPGKSKRLAAMFAGHPKAWKAAQESGMVGESVL